MAPAPKEIQSAVISRLKIMSDMDIAERRVPQDGRLSVVSRGRKIDLRVSCLPTVWGEKIVDANSRQHGDHDGAAHRDSHPRT